MLYIVMHTDLYCKNIKYIIYITYLKKRSTAVCDIWFDTDVAYNCDPNT